MKNVVETNKKTPMPNEFIRVSQLVFKSTKWVAGLGGFFTSQFEHMQDTVPAHVPFLEALGRLEASSALVGLGTGMAGGVAAVTACAVGSYAVASAVDRLNIPATQRNGRFASWALAAVAGSAAGWVGMDAYRLADSIVYPVTSNDCVTAPADPTPYTPMRMDVIKVIKTQVPAPV